jgi:putative salt-induced outer membrane protein YdiY
MFRTASLSIVAALLASFASAASAQPAPAPATVEQHKEKAAAEAAKEDVTSLAASLGGSSSTGNTRVYQVNAGVDFKLVRQPHGFGANAAFGYGQADLPNDAEENYEQTSGNFNAKARYDFYFTRMDGVFAASAFRWDHFAGLDARVQGQLGYLRYLLREENHRFWGEVGYDLTYDNYYPLPNPAFDPEEDEGPDNLARIDQGDDVIHSGRLFLGYENKLNAVLTYVGGLEGLMNVEEAKDTRVNFDNALRSAIATNLQLEVKFTLLFDNVPVLGAEKVDTQTLVNLIYNLI